MADRKSGEILRQFRVSRKHTKLSERTFDHDRSVLKIERKLRREFGKDVDFYSDINKQCWSITTSLLGGKIPDIYGENERGIFLIAEVEGLSAERVIDWQKTKGVFEIRWYSKRASLIVRWEKVGRGWVASNDLNKCVCK